MGSTNIAALAALTEPVSAFATAAIPDRLVFMQSGAMVNDLTALAGEGGAGVTLRKWSDYTTAAVADDGTAPTIQALASTKEYAPVMRRRFYFGVQNYLNNAQGPGVGALNELSNKVTYRWTREIEKAMLSNLAGVFDAAAGVLRTNFLNNVSVASGTAVPASINHVIDTVALLGDNMSDLAIAIAHPKVVADLAKEMAGKTTDVQFIRGDGSLGTMTRILGLNFYSSEQVAVSGSGAYKVYTTYILRPGALRLGMQGAMSIRAAYSAAYNRDEVCEALGFLVHTNATSYTGAVADAEGGVSNTELATATNFATAYGNAKEVGVVALRTNASKQ